MIMLLSFLCFALYCKVLCHIVNVVVYEIDIFFLFCVYICKTFYRHPVTLARVAEALITLFLHLLEVHPLVEWGPE